MQTRPAHQPRACAEAPMDDCIFCRIVAGQAPADFVRATDTVVVFMSLEGHPMVVPKRHVRDLFGRDRLTAAEIIETSIEIAQAMRRTLACDGIYVGQANGAAAGHYVFHYHMHLHPRWADGRSVDCQRTTRKAMAEGIRSAL
ncbi:MAG: HIT domain-containing protein [Pseudomonadota bacterium]